MDKQKLMVLIGTNIKACRLNAGMTQGQLAEAADISTPFIANIESGQKMVSVVTLLAISDALKVSSDALLRKAVRHDYENNIIMLLHGVSPEYLQRLERIIRVCLEEFPALESKATENMI